MTMLLTEFACREPPGGLSTVWSWHHVAGCEVLAKRRLVLVYAIAEQRDLVADLLGPPLDRALRERRMKRWLH
jgi:hypothetical protein